MTVDKNVMDWTCLSGPIDAQTYTLLSL